MYQGRDELFVIQDDIKRAAAKPGTRWAMLIDLRRCTSCKACTAGCVAEQKSPPGIVYRPVYEEEFGTFPKVKRRFTPRPCNQCDKPPCVGACPNKGEDKATWKGSDGVVRINYERCLGCGKCVVACPYKARNLDAGTLYTQGTPKVQEYEQAPSFEYGRKWARQPDQVPVGAARKCHFCLHRLKNGMLPMCVSTCTCRANYFGDPDDAESLLHRMLKENKVHVLKGVTGEGAGKVTASTLAGKRAAEIAALVGYPGKTPVFAETAPTKPRVFYILP